MGPTFQYVNYVHRGQRALGAYRAWDDIGTSSLVDVVDNSWASWGICTREGNLGRWASCTTASSDGDLEARGVELDTGVCPRRVESNKLMTDNVVPVCKGLGDGEGVWPVCDEWILFQVSLGNLKTIIEVTWEYLRKPKYHPHSSQHGQP